MVLYSIIVSFLFLLSSAFFSAAETSITGSSKTFLLNKEQQGVKRAKLLNHMLRDFDKLIISLLIGNNICNTLFTIFITSLLIDTFGGNYMFVLGVGITAVILIFSEILPKTYSFSNANNIAIILAPFVYAIVFILKPFAIIFLNMNRFLSMLLKANNNNQKHLFGSVDNLRGAIEMFDREEESQHQILQEKAMLHSILDLNELIVADIMNHRKNVFCVDIDEPEEKLIDTLINCAYTRIPVFKDNPDNIIGIISVKEVFKAYKKNPNHVEISKLIKDPYFTPESTFVIDLLMRFREKHERIALIVDEYGSFMGILTLGDILEEITGELKSVEQSNENEDIIKQSGSFIMSGDLKIRDLNRKMNLKFPDDDFTTVAGLILYETGKIPNIGNIFIFHGFKFEILEKIKHQLTKIKITPV